VNQDHFSLYEKKFYGKYLNKKIFRVNVTISDVNSAEKLGNVIVIYDGHCDFCKECVNWVERKTSITAIPFQSADLESYGVTYERCSKEVVVINKEKVFGGAGAVAELLALCGYKKFATLLRVSGPFGRQGYRWVAANRNSAVIRVVHVGLRRINDRP
jgi:predicted DCC family thiol-disulfide oxidoreductase YuxK